MGEVELRLNGNKDIGLLVLRVGLAVMFIFVHGGPKLIGGPAMWAMVGGAMSVYGIAFAPVFWGFMAALAEGLGGLLLGLGLFTRVTAIFMGFVMLTAAVSSLAAGKGIAMSSFPIELLIVFVSLIITGAGRYSIGRMLKPLEGKWYC